MQDTPIKSLVLDLLRKVREEELALAARLGEAERIADGTPERPSAKDMVAHVAAWRARHAEKLATVARGETPPMWTDTAVVDALNARAYPEYQRQSWEKVAAYAERTYAALVAAVERLSEAELADPHHFPAMRGRTPWPETLGNGAWHPLTHLAEHAHSRGDAKALARIQGARIRGQEAVLAAMARAGIPAESRAEAVYDLACLHALAGQPEPALAALREALAARPDLALHAKHDADFASLRGEPDFQALTADVREAALIAPRAVREASSGATPPLVIDVRDPEEHAAGHVAGAVNIPLGALAGRIGEIPRGRMVVTYCNMYHRGTSRGERAAAQLRASGFDTQALDGGYPGWKAAGLPVEE
jgi:rhodanese-related sulfurtransferase